MSEFNKYSTDGGATFIDVEDSNAVHWSDQSKGYVGKNRLYYDTPTQTINGLTFMVNADKSIIVNGTATANAYFYLYGTDAAKDHMYKGMKLTGCPTGGSASNYSLVAQYWDTPTHTGGENDQDIGDGVTIGDITNYIRIYIRIQNGETCNNLTFKPMITLASVPNSDYAHYEPYLTPNTEIDNKLSNTIYNILGAKNLLINYNYKVYSAHGITFTQNDDNSITINGTSNEEFYYGITNGHDPKLTEGDYIFTKGSTNEDIRIGIDRRDKNEGYISRYGATWGSELSFTYDDSENYHPEFWLQIPNNKTYDNVTIYPMVQIASYCDKNYTSSTLTNHQLAEMVSPKVYELTHSTDYENYFDWANAATKYYKIGHIVEVTINDLKCTQAVTIDSWKQLLYDLPKAINGNVEGVYVSKNRDTIIQAQWDMRNTNPTGTSKFGLAFPLALTLAQNDMLRAHLVYISI